MGLRDRLASTHDEEGGVDGIAYYRKRLLEEVDLSEFATLSAPQRRARLERVVGRMVSREGPVLSTAERTRLIRRVIDEAIGLGVLEPLLADPSVTEIMVNGLEDIFVERDGPHPALRHRVHRRGAALPDDRPDRLAGQPARGRVEPDGRRAPAHRRARQRDHPAAGAARADDHDPALPAAVHARAADGDGLDRPATSTALLQTFVRAKLNVVISGGTGAGKTTLLNALSAAVPPGERIITVEDNAELRLQQPHVVTLEARPANVEGRGEVSIRDLVRNSLRMRPDRIIVGEVRGGETLDMLQALNTGHEGSLVTVHANSCDDAVHRLETLATMSDLHDPVRGAARPDQLGDPRDRADRPLRRRPPPRRRGRRRRLAAARAVPPRHARRASRPSRCRPTAASSGVTRHYPLPPGILRWVELAGERVPDVFVQAAADTVRAPEREAG